jgi:hypothetical protein
MKVIKHNPVTHIAVCLCGAWAPVSLRSDKHEPCPFCGYPSPALYRIGQQVKVRTCSLNVREPILSGR